MRLLDFIWRHAIEFGSEPWFLWIGVLSFVAGFVRGLLGFGSAMIMLPLFSVVVGMGVAVPVVQAVDSAFATPVAVLELLRGHCKVKEIWPLAIPAVLCAPLGVFVLGWADERLLRLGAGLIVLFAVYFMWKGYGYEGQVSKLVSALVGAVSGLLGGATTLSGPPVVLFWLGGKAAVGTVRANLFVFFAMTELVTLVIYWASGRYTEQALVYCAGLGVIFGLGVWMGTLCVRFVSEGVFRKVALGVTGLTAVSAIVLAW